ncbi:uncharacterized protein LOC106659363 isoform X1 [Trichogramma pretiosum]|uniref:uncharacterized protein LOC106659363 isoform X1 n=1 Tax=Trichogramma pretiosum TaxID=7493 RepID=UPI0006C9BAB9|nr:uncharacterized protein LOC106659363 isoform X1 [Trichogramma pretiosum]XP_023315617.1 uncharacterized protein LOC106659363 isoform X1 [Trichogramma pretiosum]
MQTDKKGMKDSLESKKVAEDRARESSGKGALSEDPPPAYDEAMQNVAASRNHNDTTPKPSAPTDNSIDANRSQHTTTSQPPVNNVPYPMPTAPYDERFRNWDENATRILIVNRLQMNDRFSAARTRWDEELLWTLILNDLLTHGYVFSIIDLMSFWKFQYDIYKSIVDGVSSSLTSSNHSSSWQYFEPMHSVFGSSGDAAIVDTATTVLPTTSVLPHTPLVPITTNEGQTLYNVSENGTIAAAGTADASPYTHIPEGSNPATSILPSTDSPMPIALTSESVGISSDPFVNGGTDSLDPTAAIGDPTSVSLLADVFTSDDGVITTQPTFSSASLALGASSYDLTNHDGDDDCCGGDCCGGANDGDYCFGDSCTGDAGDDCGDCGC